MSKAAKKQATNARKSIPAKPTAASRHDPSARGKSRLPKAGSKTDGGIAARPDTKIATVVDMLRSERGATLDQMMRATGWQRHSVRGAISGSIKRKLKLAVRSEIVDGERYYRVTK